MVKIPKIELKLLRDVKAAKLQFGAVALIILLGVAIFIGLYGAYLNLEVSYNTTFKRLDMADYWISVDRISQTAVRRMNEIPGVTATGRIIEDISIDLENDSGEKVTARVISLPAHSHPEVNNILVEEGSYFDSASSREVLVEKSFADYHKFAPGDWITLKRDGAIANFKVAGIVTSPEFIWVVKSEQEPMPSPRTFGILFMTQTAAENVFGMAGMYNEIAVVTAPNINEKEFIAEIKQVLRDYGIARITTKDDATSIKSRKFDIIKGVRSAYLLKRDDQPSNRLLKQDLDSFASLAFLFPLLFLSMASLTIYVLMNRMVESQRMQIGIMRAIGYSRLAVLRHYLGFGLIVGIIGSVLGAILGNFIANGYTSLYVDQLNLPYTVTTTHWDIIITGIIIGTAVPLLAGLLPAWSALRIRPVEAMRPPIPATGNRILLKITEIFLHRLPYILKLPTRNIFRNVRRSVFMSLGVASAALMVLVSMSFVDALDAILNTQWDIIEDYDGKIVFQGTGTASTATFVSHLDGIKDSEPYLEVAYRIRYGDNVIDTSIMGLAPNSSMYHLVTPKGDRVEVVDDGILLPASFKNKLGAQIGDTLSLEPIVGTVGETEKRLAGFLEMPIGARAFMSLEEVQRLLRQPGTATGIFVDFSGEPSNLLMKRLYNLPQVTSVELTSDTRALIDEQMGFFWVFIGVMLLMGAALGTAIIFNGVTVNVLQRIRELAIMRALGVSRAGLAAILSLENFAIGCLGIIIGIPAGRYIAEYFMSSMSTSTDDMFSFTLTILPRSYIIAVVFALIILMVSQLPAIRQVTRISLAIATKEWAE